jgi:outer membrane beta-barrel protein
MKKTRIGLLVAALLCALPPSAWAQGKKPAAGDKPAAEGDAAAGTEPGKEGGEGAAAAGEGGEAAGDEGELPAEVPGGEEIPGGEGLGDICKIDPAACPKLDMNKEAAKPLKEPIYAVQQAFVLKVRRVELNPYWITTLNDQFVSHPGFGLAVNYYITNVLALGINGSYYRPFNVDSDFNAQVRRAGRVGVPLTEYNWGAAFNMTYVPAYGKFAGFGDFIFHYDAYIVGGVGALASRPIPVIDPDNRNFDWKTNLAFNAGIGLRIFFNRWFAAVLEVRDYIFQDKLENTSIATTPQQQQDPGTWYGENKLTNNVQAQVGVSIFIPFTFDYRLPK